MRKHSATAETSHRIDLECDDLLTLAAASKKFPGRPTVRTIWRWIRKGVYGVKLHTILVGGKRYTRLAWMSEFVDATTAAADSRMDQQTNSRDRRRQRIDDAEAELDRAGIRA